MMGLRKATLPDGSTVFCLQDADVGLMWRHVEAYFSSDIDIDRNAVVLDIGANIGLFTTYVNSLCDCQVTIHAFEPIPEIFEILQANCKSLNNKMIKAHRFGLWSTTADRVFNYYNGAPAMSSTVPETYEELCDFMVNHVDVMLRQGRDEGFLQHLRKIPENLRTQAIEGIAKNMFKPQKVTCSVTTLSDFIDEAGIDRIDLLKIDVEKAEWEVLAGLRREHSSMVRQLCAEVHNIDGRVEAIKALLKDHGFNKFSVTSEDEFKSLDIYNFYAWR